MQCEFCHRISNSLCDLYKVPLCMKHANYSENGNLCIDCESDMCMGEE